MGIDFFLAASALKKIIVNINHRYKLMKRKVSLLQEMVWQMMQRLNIKIIPKKKATEVLHQVVQQLWQLLRCKKKKYNKFESIIETNKRENVPPDRNISAMSEALAQNK